MKTEEIRIECEILQRLYKNNTRGNTVHFSTEESSDGCLLQILTRNIYNNEIFVLKEISGTNRIVCLKKILQYVEETYKEDNNYTVYWTDSKGKNNISYFRGRSEDEIISKFHFDKYSIAKIDKIKLNPIS